MNDVRRIEAVAEQLMLAGIPAGDAYDRAQGGMGILSERENGQHPTDRYYPAGAAAPLPDWIEAIAEEGGPGPEGASAERIIDAEIVDGHFVIDGVATVITAPNTNQARFFKYSNTPKL